MKRIEKMVEGFSARKLDGMLVTGAINRRWATGFASSDGALLITREKSYFITDSRYILAAQEKVKDAQVIQIGMGEKYPELIANLLSGHKLRRLGFEEEVMTQKSYTAYQEELKAELVPAQELLSDLRKSKDQTEREAIQKAQAITDETFSQILKMIVPGMTERELAAEIIYRLLKNGAEKPSFDPIVVSGPRSSMPHGKPGDYPLEGFVTMDFGAVYDGYCADMTRTVSVGEPTEEMRAVYDTVLKAQLAGIAAARADVLGKDVDAAARAVIEAAGYGAYFGHGLGHSIGLEVHEPPKASPMESGSLPCGAVISAEPGIYLPGKFGVRIEDLLYITDSGCENLTKSPKELIILC